MNDIEKLIKEAEHRRNQANQRAIENHERFQNGKIEGLNKAFIAAIDIRDDPVTFLIENFSREDLEEALRRLSN